MSDASASPPLTALAISGAGHKDLKKFQLWTLLWTFVWTSTAQRGHRDYDEILTAGGVTEARRVAGIALSFSPISPLPVRLNL